MIVISSPIDMQYSSISNLFNINYYSNLSAFFILK